MTDNPTDIGKNKSTVSSMIDALRLEIRELQKFATVQEDLIVEGGNPRANIKVPKKLTAEQTIQFMKQFPNGFPLADENAFFGIARALSLESPELFDVDSFDAYEKKFGSMMEMQEKGASASKNIVAGKPLQAANEPVTKGKPTVDIYSTLNKEEKKAIASFQQLQEMLFPDGKIPSVEQIRERIVSGKYTIRDAFIGRMYDIGVPEQSLFSDLDETKAFYKKFEKTFSKKVTEPAIGVTSIATNLRSVTNKGIDLDSSFTELEKLAVDPSSGISDNFRTNVTRPLRTSTNNVEQLKLASRVAGKGSKKLAKGAIPPEVLQSVLDGIADIPDEVTRDAVMASLLGYRGTDLSNIRISRALAVRAGVPRPYYDRESGITRDPEVKTGRGRKPAGADRPPGPVLREILNRRFDAAGPTGELFPDIETATITKALKDHVFNKIPQSVIDNLIQKPTGYTDLRRITASAIANQLGRPDLASQIISHKGEDIIDVVLTGYYTDVEDLSGLEQRGKILTAFEKMMADAVDATDAKGLADKLNLNLPETFNADYDEIDIAKPSAAPTGTREATPEEIEQGKRVREAKTNVQVEQARLQSAELGTKADEAILSRAEQAEDVAIAEEKIAQARTDVRKEKKVQQGKNFLKSIFDTYGKNRLESSMLAAAVAGKTLTEVVPGPFVDIAGALFDPESMSEADKIGRQTARKLFPDSPTAEGLGSLAAVTGEMATGMVVNPEQTVQTALKVGSAFSQPSLAAMQMFLENSRKPESETKRMVNQARRAAMQGEETSLGSFLEPQYP